MDDLTSLGDLAGRLDKTHRVVRALLDAGICATVRRETVIHVDR